MKVLLVAAALVSSAVLAQPPVFPPAKFSDGWQSTDPKTGISMKVIQSHTSPRCRAEGNCPWMIKWNAPKRGFRAEIIVDAGFLGETASYVPTDLKEEAKLPPHVYRFAPAAVQFVRIVITDAKGNEVARAVFR